MDPRTPGEVRLATRRALLTFYALLVCIGLIVTLTRIPFGHPGITIAIALTIASVQAALVAGFLMQLVAERWMVFGLLALTGLFFLVLIFLILGAHADHTSRFFH